MPRIPNSSPQTRELLTAMAQQPRSWHYGYELSKHVGLQSGTLYPLLIRLSDQGFLESQWLEPERPGKPARHAYKLTPSGLALARQWAASSKPSLARHKVAGATI